jgi:hypothetical protein
MAYTDPLDPITPTDADRVSGGDDRIRELKRALIERFSTIIEDLDDDPLVLKDEVFPVPTPSVLPGALTARPNPPAAEHQLYHATDTDQLFVSRDSVASPGTLEWVEAKKTQLSEPIILALSAGEERFAPEGTETRAARVQSAIAAARLGTSTVKVVYIPQSLWGYCGDVDFSSSMFDVTILLVREGAIDGWYDPIAYGADPAGVVNSRTSIDTCFLHASTTTIGSKLVAFTVPGSYLFTADVDQRGCALFKGAGVTFMGGGNLTGTQAFKLPADAYVAPAIDAAFTYNADASAPRATVVTVAKRLHVRVSGTANGSGQITISFGDSGFGGAYSLANLITCVLSYRTSAGSLVSSTIYSINTGTNVLTIDLDGGAQTITGDLFLTFSA